MSRVELPDFIREVFDDVARRNVLVACCLAVFAVGLVPHLLAPGLPSAQEAVRQRPEIQNLFLLLAFTSTATILIGGLVSDIYRHRSLMVGGLFLMMVGAALCIVIDFGPLFYVANFASVAAAGVVLAYGIGSVAIAYQGVPRATALGFVYAAFGLGAAASPAVLTLFPVTIPSTDPAVPPGFSFETALAYALAAVASGVALFASYRYVPRIPGNLPASPRLVAGVSIWSLSILAIVSGVLGLIGPGDVRLPVALTAGGAVGLVVMTLLLRRAGDALGSLLLDRRAVSAALAVGIAIGFAQAIPLMLLPVVFEYALHYGTLFAVLALVPFGLAMVLAGPITGILLRRYGPRGIMSVGTLALALADIAMALVLFGLTGAVRGFYEANPGDARVDLGAAHYLLFILPLAMIGGGFVLATTVRTAIVFASTPRGLPATAAAVNEASVGLGSRIGIVTATLAVVMGATASARDMFSQLPGPDAEALLEGLEDVLYTLGTPIYKELYQAGLRQSEPVEVAAYAVAYLDGVTVALVIGGAVGLLGAGLAWWLIGRRDPIQSVFDMQDERLAAGQGDA